MRNASCGVLVLPPAFVRALQCSRVQCFEPFPSLRLRGGPHGDAAATLTRLELILTLPQKPVSTDLARNAVPSRDCSRRVDAIGLGGCGARWIEGGEGTVARPQEAVNADCVLIGSRDCSRRVDSVRQGVSLHPREIERGQAAIAGPQEAVQAVSVDVPSRDCSRPVDAIGLGGCGARRIDRGECPLWAARRKP